MKIIACAICILAVCGPAAGQTPPSATSAASTSSEPPPSSYGPAPSTGQQPAGLGTTGEGGVTAGSLGIGAGPAAVVNAPGASVRDPLRPAGAAGPLRQNPASPDQPTTPASAGSDWSSTGRANASSPPAGYEGPPSDWMRHAAACRARYRTYDPRTDMFFARPGVPARCRL